MSAPTTTNNLPKRSKQSKIKGFFKPVNEKMDKLNVQKQFLIDDESRTKEKESSFVRTQERLKIIKEKDAFLKQKSKELRAERNALNKAIELSIIDDINLKTSKEYVEEQEISDIL